MTRVAKSIGRMAMAGFAVLAFASSFPANGQAGIASSSGVVSGAILPLGNVIREIDDPHSGDCWLLLRNPNHPGGPGRLVLAPQRADARGETATGRARTRETDEKSPVIHAGDALMVEEHTAVVDARLAAVALGAAARGGEFRAQLKIGGKVVRVIASGPGRAVFAPESEARP